MLPIADLKCHLVHIMDSVMSSGVVYSLCDLDEHKLLSDRQHAFRKNRSCETQLFTVINDWAKSLDAGCQVDTFISDFEKAFGTPPHELLKLHGYGISGKNFSMDGFISVQ